MKKLTSYIFRELLITFFFMVSILIAFVWVIQSLKFIGPFLKSSEGFFSFVWLIFLTLPDLLVIVAPIGLFISIVILYNRLHTDRELPVMFSAGYSIWQIARPAIRVSLGVTLFIYFLNIFILPASFEKIRDMELQLKSSFPSVLVQEGVFTSFGDITIYVNKKNGQSIEGIIAYVYQPNRNPYTIMAKQGRIIVENRMPKIFMAQGVRQEKDIKTGDLSILYFDRTIISLAEEVKSSQDVRPKKPYELSIFELISPSNMTLPHGQKLYAEGYQRLLSPLYSVSFSLVGLCFLLYSPFRRRGQLFAIIQSVSVVLFLQSILLFLMNLGIKTWYAIFIAYFLMVTTILSCFIILKSSEKR